VEIIKSLNDDRIQLIQKPKNTGYTNSLNFGIQIAKGEYIARMDGDDISLPTRFEKQVAFLQLTNDASLCGSAIQIIRTNKILKHPTANDEIKLKLCFSNSFYHPTMMFKKSILVENNYDENFEPAEDYDLWTKLIFKMKMYNMEEVLLKYRIHDNQISNRKQELQLKSAAISQMRMFQVLFDSKIDLELFAITFNVKPTIKISDLKAGLIFFKEIKANNAILKIYHKLNFEKQIDSLKINFIKNFIKNNDFTLNNFLNYLRYFEFSDLLILGGFKKMNKNIKFRL
jgi:glycosyltransferase involved in cell wall biosynthesis